MKIIFEDKVFSGRKRYRAKKHLEKLGVNVTSIDINGKGGSLVVDLSLPLPEKYKEGFQLVYNIGTSEHVKDHIICFKNMHYACKKGGIMFNLVPRKGFWNRSFSHRNVHKYNIEFFDKFAKDNDCEVHTNRVVHKERLAKQDDMILAILIKR